jgi:dTDP-4-amino-4,6-dideoxy-D-galactose acyltransferase
MTIEYLEWDSNFFGFKIGKIGVLPNTEFDWVRFKEVANNEKYELIYVFTFQNMLPWKDVLVAELELVDIQLTMSRIFKKKDYLDLPYDYRTQISEPEKCECYDIAEQTSRVSRFYKEREIGPIKSRELYRKWIDNALKGIFSDGLFLQKEVDTVAGIHLIKTDRVNKVGYFTLTGVDSNYKRMGIGNKLWKQSFAYWAQESDIEIIRSPFSFQNLESFNFHLKMGFNKIEETKYIYHFRNTYPR